jgi:hypothetical protein
MKKKFNLLANIKIFIDLNFKKDQNDAANVITECFISRSLEQKSSLLLAFHQSNNY